MNPKRYWIIVSVITVLAMAAFSAGAAMLATGQHRQAKPLLPTAQWTQLNDSTDRRSLSDSRASPLPEPNWQTVHEAACQQNRYRFLLVREGDAPAMSQAVLTDVHSYGGRAVSSSSYSVSRLFIAAPGVWDNRATQLDLLNAPTDCDAGFGRRPEITDRPDRNRPVDTGYAAWAHTTGAGGKPEPPQLLPSVIVILEQPAGLVNDADAEFAAWGLIGFALAVALITALVAIPFLPRKRERNAAG